jgi:hypothetical protein
MNLIRNVFTYFLTECAAGNFIDDVNCVYQRASNALKVRFTYHFKCLIKIDI